MIDTDNGVRLGNERTPTWKGHLSEVALISRDWIGVSATLKRKRERVCVSREFDAYGIREEEIIRERDRRGAKRNLSFSSAWGKVTDKETRTRWGQRKRR